MIDIVSYLNYREFLRDLYLEKKAANPAFSYQVLANKAGFRSKSFLAHVIDGTKNLSEESAQKLAAALALSERERAYFELLVGFDQARSHNQKDQYFRQIVAQTSRKQARLLSSAQYDFYSSWYHSTVRELVKLLDFRGDFAGLARHVRPRISARQARQSINLLLRPNLVRREGDRYVQCDPHITTGDTVRSLAIENFHLQNLNLAGESMDTCPAQERDLSCMVITVSREGFARLRDEIRAFRKRLVAMVDEDQGRERVYHLSMQLFPTSEPCRRGDDHEIDKEE